MNIKDLIKEYLNEILADADYHKRNRLDLNNCMKEYKNMHFEYRNKRHNIDDLSDSQNEMLEEYYRLNNQADKSENVRIYPSSRRYAPQKNDYSTGMFWVFFPHLFGFVVGLAFARLFQLTNFWVYVIFGFVFACLVGTLKSNVFDDIKWKHALIKNLVISGLYMSAIFVVFIFSKIFLSFF